MNLLSVDDRSGTMSSPKFLCMQDVLREVLTVEHAVKGGAAAAELLWRSRRRREGGPWTRGASSAGRLVP